jgi:hypothetical protein
MYMLCRSLPSGAEMSCQPRLVSITPADSRAIYNITVTILFLSVIGIQWWLLAGRQASMAKSMVDD